ncbi:HNH endonuclease [Streptomyces sp. NPDC102473]|uniref:HNH endonuclease n=1 Tax=Streptomyces sp. NPDC102473 TaxID=3366180 RepID=UPI00381C9B42
MPDLALMDCARCTTAFQPRRRDQRWCSRQCKNAFYNAEFRSSGTLSPAAKERQRLYWQAKNRRRRAAKRGGASEPYTLVEIAERDEARCRLCGDLVLMSLKVPHAGAPTIDHIVPVSRGGNDTRANVQLAHFRCNSVKGAREVQTLTLGS